MGKQPRKHGTQALMEAPDYTPAWLGLGELLIQEGKDWSAAEAVLRELLAIDPEHAPTKRKLETIMERPIRP